MLFLIDETLFNTVVYGTMKHNLIMRNLLKVKLESTEILETGFFVYIFWSMSLKKLLEFLNIPLISHPMTKTLEKYARLKCALSCILMSSPQHSGHWPLTCPMPIHMTVMDDHYHSFINSLPPYCLITIYDSRGFYFWLIMNMNDINFRWVCWTTQHACGVSYHHILWTMTHCWALWTQLVKF